MARNFNGTSEYLRLGSAVVTAPPLLMTCWFTSTRTNTWQWLMGVANSGAAAADLSLWTDNTADVFVQTYNSTYNGSTTTGTYSANTWNHAAGVISATNRRRAFLNGVGATANTTSITTPTVNSTSIGARYDNSPDAFHSGNVAEAAIWDLTGYDITWVEERMIPSLADGCSPLFFPKGLKGYWPLGGLHGQNDKDIWGGNALTPIDTPSWADHPGKLIYPSNSLWLPATVAAAVPSLVVGDSEFVVESDTVALTQHHVLTVGGSECVVESDTVTLTQHQALTVQDSECLVESEQPALVQHQALTVQDSECLVESEQPALTQHQALVVGDGECAVESESPALTQHHVLAVANSECLVESEQPVLVQHHALAAADAECVVESDNVTLAVVGQLTVQDSECLVESDTVTLIQHHVLTVPDSECAVESDNVLLALSWQLIVQGSECVVESDNVTLEVQGLLAVQDSECAVESESPALTQHQVLAVADNECAVESDEVTLSASPPTSGQAAILIQQHFLLAA